jgi:hypothetical protein
MFQTTNQWLLTMINHHYPILNQCSKPPTRKHVFVSCEFFSCQQNVDRTRGLPAIAQTEKTAQPQVVILQASMEIHIENSYKHTWKLWGIVWKQVLYQNFMVFDSIWSFIPYSYLYKYANFYGHQMFRHTCAMVRDIWLMMGYRHPAIIRDSPGWHWSFPNIKHIPETIV